MKIGDIFGELTILEINKDIAKCYCSCGNICEKRKWDIGYGKIKSCGCIYRTAKVSIGDRFKMLEVIEIIDSKKVKVQCDCNNQKIVSKYDLLYGDSKSCGCMSFVWTSSSHITHNMTGSRLYTTYHNMINRCYNSKSDFYYIYGGRGIKVCQDWLIKEYGFINFFKWAFLHGYKDDLEIDRIDNDNHYCPNNCRWVTEIEQSNNKRNTIYITFEGKTKSIAQWSRDPRCIVNKRTFNNRIKMGWDVLKALITPPIIKR